ncbi:MAG: AI-2E family transporter [Planctomycetota bacterium]|jgi:predicted PurR-regulated permease PerM
MPDTDPRTLRRRLITLVVFLVLILGLVWAFRAVLMPFLVALFFAYLIDPVVERLAEYDFGGRFRIGRAGSIVLIYLVLISATTVGVLYAIPALGRQAAEVREDLPKAVEWAEETLAAAQKKWDALIGWEARDEAEPAATGLAKVHMKGGGLVEGRVVYEDKDAYWLKVGSGPYLAPKKEVEHLTRVAPGAHGGFQTLAQQGAATLSHNLNAVLGFAVGFARTILGALTLVVLIMMITAFVIIDREKIVEFIHGLPPPRYREKTERLLDYLDHGLAGVIRGQLMICLVNGVLTWLGLWMLGVKYATLLGLIAGIFSLIPIFGTILSTIPIVLIAWGAGSVQKGMLALGWILLIHFIEANFLNPKIMGSASKIHPVVVIFALLAGEHAYGIVGALLAVPTASIVQSGFKFFVLDKQAEAA